MTKAKLPVLILFVKLGTSQPSLAVLEYINANIHVFRRFCRIRVTAFTTDELENPRILQQLEDYNITGLPALLTHKGNVLFGAESITKFIHPANFKQEKEKEEQQRKQARRYDDDDLLSEWNNRMMDLNDQEDDERDLKKDISAKQSEDLRDNKLSKLVQRARGGMTSQNSEPVTSTDKINKARYGSSGGKQRGGPERSRDTAIVSEVNEVESGLSNSSSQKNAKNRIQDDDDLTYDIKPPGRSNGNSIRNKALNGASKDRTQRRSNNISAFDDGEDAVDKMLNSISKNGID